MDILFYTTGEDWDIFSNVAGLLPVEIVIADTHYSSTSTEGIFQGMKHIVPQAASPVNLAKAKTISLCKQEERSSSKAAIILYG